MEPLVDFWTRGPSLGPIPVGDFAIAAGVLVAVALLALFLGRRWGRRNLAQRLTAIGSRLGLDPPAADATIEAAVTYLEQVTGSAAEAVNEASSDAIRLRRSLETLPQGIVVCDDSGAVVYRNAPANALVASRHSDALAAQAVSELLESAWNDGDTARTLDLYGPPRRTLSIRVHPIDDGRRPLGVMAVIEDVSERRRLDEIRRDFVANVSHELKTPMGALGLLAETLVTEPDTEVARRLADRIHTEAFRVSRIIDDLLDLSRIESSETQPRDPIRINLVMAEAVERVRSAADQRGVEIVLDEPSPPLSVLGDRRQLVSALHALLENAVNYSYEGGKILLSGRKAPDLADLAELADRADRADREDRADRAARAEAADMATPAGGAGIDQSSATAADSMGRMVAPGNGDQADVGEPASKVLISVVDHGIGIPARDLDRIFERFYRVDHGRTRSTGGTGLGLSIVRHVASNHQGRVDVESREGEGSTFTLVLPPVPDVGQ